MSNPAIGIADKGYYWNQGANLDKATARALLADSDSRPTIKIPAARKLALIEATKESDHE